MAFRWSFLCFLHERCSPFTKCHHSVWNDPQGSNLFDLTSFKGVYERLAWVIMFKNQLLFQLESLLGQLHNSLLTKFLLLLGTDLIPAFISFTSPVSAKAPRFLFRLQQFCFIFRLKIIIFSSFWSRPSIYNWKISHSEYTLLKAFNLHVFYRFFIGKNFG